MDVTALSPSMKVYLVNLDRCSDRLQQMEQQLARLGLAFERVPAVDGSKLCFPHENFDEAGYRALHGRRPNAGEVGCYFSHIECARRLLASQAEFALILEDDLSFAPDFTEALSAAIRKSDTWDMLRLSTVSRGLLHPYADLCGGRQLAVALTREKGSGAYVINRRTARWFVENLVPMKLPFDIAFDLEFQAKLAVSFIMPPPVDQRNGFASEIQPRSRRANHLSRWHYATVLPFRAAMEVRRFFARGLRLLQLRLRRARHTRSSMLAASTLSPASDLGDLKP